MWEHMGNRVDGTARNKEDKTEDKKRKWRETKRTKTKEQKRRGINGRNRGSKERVGKIQQKNERVEEVYVGTHEGTG